jgi:N-acetylmuramoyl-L-alanine amidase
MMTPLLCLASAIFFEARGEPVSGMQAVANVIINRVEDERYPKTVCGLTDDPEDYTGHQDKLAWVTSQEVAEEALQGNLLGITSTHFHTVNIKVYWSKHYALDARVAGHYFYTNETPYK